MTYAVITENDVSQWKDKTGELYHFPGSYINILPRDTLVIYYKGKLKEKAFENLRLSSTSHYFGMGTIGNVYEDAESKSNFFIMRKFVITARF